MEGQQGGIRSTRMAARSDPTKPWPRRLDGAWLKPAAPADPAGNAQDAGSLAEFQARGACVPFETPALQAARVRADDREGMCLLLRNFASNNATYVLPWDAVPSTIPMTTRDRALHHEVAAVKALTPRAMRSAMRTVAAAGFAGEEAQAAVVQSITEDRKRAAELQATVLVRALDACGFSREYDSVRKLELVTTPAALRTAASALRMSPSQLFATTELVAQELLPVGMRLPTNASDPDQAGPLRRMLAQLGSFSHHLRERIDGAPPSLRAQYERAADAADATIEQTNRAFARIDRELANMHILLTAWSTRRDNLRREFDQLYWLLDGWEPTIEHYTMKLAEWLALSQERTLAMLSSIRPPAVPPRSPTPPPAEPV